MNPNRPVSLQRAALKRRAALLQCQKEKKQSPLRNIRGESILSCKNGTQSSILFFKMTLYLNNGAALSFVMYQSFSFNVKRVRLPKKSVATASKASHIYSYFGCCLASSHILHLTSTNGYCQDIDSLQGIYYILCFQNLGVKLGT